MDEKAYKKGRWSFYKDEACPYKGDTYAAKEWMRGYNAAFFENQAKVKERENGRKSR